MEEVISIRAEMWKKKKKTENGKSGKSRKRKAWLVEKINKSITPQPD